MSGIQVKSLNYHDRGSGIMQNELEDPEIGPTHSFHSRGVGNPSTSPQKAAITKGDRHPLPHNHALNTWVPG